MELGKKTVSGEELEFLKSISPVIAKIAGTATSLELKADQLFKDTKKGKTAKQKFYIFIGILLFDRQPIIMKKKFTWEVRSNIGTKSEVEAILTEAGVKDTKAIFERAKRYYETSEKEKTAAKPTSSKGKPEHASESRRLPRGLRARMSRTREENNGWEDPNNEEARRWEEFMRPPTEEERKRWEEIAKRLRAEQAERNRWHREFKRKEAAAWQRQFPGKPYTPHETYNYIYNETTDTWEKIDFSEPPPNPFYNNERGYRAPNAPPPPNNEVPPEPPRRGVSCNELLKQKGILVAGDTPKETKKKFLMWAIVNHPDKGGDTETFQEVSNCYDREIKPLLPHGGGNITRRRRKH